VKPSSNLSSKPDVGRLCLEPSELDEVIDIVRHKDLGPEAASRLQTLIDAEYDQWVGTLDVLNPMASAETASTRRTRMCGTEGTAVRRKVTRPLAKRRCGDDCTASYRSCVARTEANVRSVFSAEIGPRS